MRRRETGGELLMYGIWDNQFCWNLVDFVSFLDILKVSEDRLIRQLCLNLLILDVI